MFDPTDLYRLGEDVPELTDPVLLYHFDGFVDAGGAGRSPWGTSSPSWITGSSRPSMWTACSTTGPGVRS
nr:hypothetical protein GCM10020093_042740 [Planobispora longispora]